MTTGTIQELLNSSFYILENPETGLLSIGPLSNSASHVGRFVGYEPEANTIFLSEPDYHLRRADLAVHLQEMGFKEPLKSLNWDISSVEDYEESFHKVQNEFKRSDLEKVILYRQATAEIKDSLSTFFKILNNILLLNANGYIYAVFDKINEHFFIGLAPEFLFKKDRSGNLKTVAVAGTGGLDENLLSNKKLLIEQEAVERSISTSLESKVKWSNVEEEVHFNLKHLVSNGVINGFKASELSDKLHPTSAVGSMPKGYPLSFKPGPEPRGFYGGFAELLGDSPFSLVLIRGLEFSLGKLKMRFGGGVIQESELEKELIELDLKFQNLKKLCGL